MYIHTLISETITYFDMCERVVKTMTLKKKCHEINNLIEYHIALN